MNINPYLPSPLLGGDRLRNAVAPVQPTAPPRDAVREQRDAAQRLVLPEPLRRQAEQVLADRGAPAGEEPRARRALDAYQAVARQNEHEYVTNILGIDEFA